MSLFYLSFCDTTKPAGQRFLGATVVEARDPKHAIERASALGINPGGEVAIVKMFGDVDDLETNDQLKYLHRFVPREVVLAEPHEQIAVKATPVHQHCNPVKRSH